MINVIILCKFIKILNLTENVCVCHTHTHTHIYILVATFRLLNKQEN